MKEEWIQAGEAVVFHLQYEVLQGLVCPTPHGGVKGHTP